MPQRPSAAVDRTSVSLPPQLTAGLGIIFGAMRTIPEALAIAIQHHQAGRLQAAESIYRQILQVEPDHAEALHVLGILNAQAGHHQVAVEYLRRALMVRPDWAEAHANLGNALREQGKPDEAVPYLRRALQLRPDYAEARNNLGNALESLGNLDEAIACYRRAIALKPDLAEAHSNLGNANKARGNLDEAIACYRRAIELRPDFAAAYHNLAVTLCDLGKPDDAAACCRRALELRPDHAEAHYTLGIASTNLGKPDDAIACYRRALALKPDFAAAHNDLGNALRGQGHLVGAVACYRRALGLKPDFAAAYNNLGNAFRDQANLDEALACYRRALALKADFATAHSNLLYTLQYCAEVTPTALAEAHAEYDRQHAAALYDADVAPHEKVHRVQGPPRLGFISPDLGRHPVGFFLVRVLEELARGPHETTCYSDRIVEDSLTHRLRAAATRWRNVAGMSHERLAEQVRADRIDILFDLAGHTASNRLLVFARKPAPIQVSWIGYEGTTGLAAMDYLLADHLMVSAGSERHYRERILRMPDGYLCYDPPESAPPVGPAPALTQGFTTFGSFNNPAKITPEVVAVWAKASRGADRATGHEISRPGRSDREKAVPRSLCRPRGRSATAGLAAMELVFRLPGDLSSGGCRAGSVPVLR